MVHRRRLVLCFALVVGCAANDDESADGATDTTGPEMRASIRDGRYCELILATLAGEVVEAEVWGTPGLSDCPAPAWDAIDADAVRDELGLSAVLKNGPRYWTIDQAEATATPSTEVQAFGDLELRKLATLTLEASAVGGASSYVERTINRESRFVFFAGTPVYELTSAAGTTYVMQSYAQIVDPALDTNALADLGGRLQLPEGWSYRTRILEQDLEVLTPGEATVVQDELQNTYSRVGPGI